MQSKEDKEELMMKPNINPHNQIECNLSQVKKVEIIGRYYKACAWNNLFLFICTAAIEDALAVMVQNTHAVEVDECLKDIKKDLMYFRNMATQEKVFFDNLLQELSFKNTNLGNHFSRVKKYHHTTYLIRLNNTNALKY